VPRRRGPSRSAPRCGARPTGTGKMGRMSEPGRPTPGPAPMPVPRPGPPPHPPAVVQPPAEPRPAVSGRPESGPAQSSPAQSSPARSSTAAEPLADPATFGRVEPDGTVYVRTKDGERSVGQVPDVSEAEALAFFTRRFDALVVEVDLLER